MKKILFLLLLLGCVGIAGAQRYAIVDSKYILEKMQDYKTAQSKLDDGVRVLDKEHPGHHLLGVFEFRPVRLADAHGALDPFRAKVEVAHPILFGQGDRRKLRFAGRAARGG